MSDDLDAVRRLQAWISDAAQGEEDAIGVAFALLLSDWLELGGRPDLVKLDATLRSYERQMEAEP